MGQRDNEFFELICRGILELMYNDEKLFESLKKNYPNIKRTNFVNPMNGKELMLMIALKDIEDEMIRIQIYK